MEKIKLHQELYSLIDTRDVLTTIFPGWTSKVKVRAIFQYHPEYEVIIMGEGKGQRYFIKKEKLEELINDIKTGKVK